MPGDLISEVALAIEMGATAADVGLTVHPHPTLSETVAFAAEAFEGTLTDLYHPEEVATGPAAVLCGHRQMSRMGHCGQRGFLAMQT